jgi:hypothetical protein
MRHMRSMMLIMITMTAVVLPAIAVVLPMETASASSSTANVTPFESGFATLDKTGTTGVQKVSRDPQALATKQFGDHGSLNTERGGFEPPVRFNPHTAFPVPHNRPLCHLSWSFVQFKACSLYFFSLLDPLESCSGIRVRNSIII